jgi:outer membrane protein, heavy metal efflux system
MSSRLRRGALLGLAWLSGAAVARGQVGAPAPVTLREVLERAQARAPEAVALAAAEAEADATGRLSGPLRTGLSLHTEPAYVAGVPGPVVGHWPTIAGVELRQSFYDPGRQVQAEQAKASLAEARGEAGLARLRAAEQAASLFGRCRGGDAAIHAAEAKVGARRAAQERTARLRQEGRATPLDEQRARLAVAQTELELRRARSERELDALALRRLLGLPADAPLLFARESGLLDPGPDGADDLEAARAADPRLRAMSEQVAAEESAVRIRGRLFAPSLDAFAQYSRLYKTADWDDFYKTFKPDSWSVGASLSLPLFASGRSAEAARSTARLDRLRAERAARERDLEIEVRRAQQSLEDARAGIEVSRLAEAVAVEDLRVGRALLAEGRLDPADLAEKEQLLAEAERDQVRAEADLVLAQVRRLALRGELPPASAP